MFDIGKKFAIEIPGRGTLQLGPNDHVASGGEGHIYKKGALCVKIWEDANRAVQGRMPEKIVRLAALKHPFIVTPDGLALDTHGRPIGMAMPWVAKAWALPLAFTNDWRSANRFGDAEALAFATRMREATQFIHSKGVVLGDGNELNILGVAGKSGAEPRYIDTDPWVMPGFPGDKILPTIRDWNSPPFSLEADWFAWAVVSFQLLIGIHPYRGTHPQFKRNDLEGRMKANASVFDPQVRLPPAVRPLSGLPTVLRDWYRAVFDGGHRGVPPDLRTTSTGARRVAAGQVAAVRGALTITERYTLAAAALRVVASDILLLDGGEMKTLVDGRVLGRADPNAAFIRLADGTVAGARIDADRVYAGTLRAAPGAVMAFADAGLAGQATWAADNRLFILVHDGLLELRMRDLAGKMAALPGRTWALNPNTTTLGDGIALWDALGAKHLVVPFDANAVAVVRVSELDGLKTVAMVRRGRVAALSLLDPVGNYKRAVLCFNDTYTTYQISLEDADSGQLTDTITETGVVVWFDEQGQLRLAAPLSGGSRQADPGVAASGRLLSGPSGVYCAVADKMFKIELA